MKKDLYKPCHDFTYYGVYKVCKPCRVRVNSSPILLNKVRHNDVKYVCFDEYYLKEKENGK